MISADEFKDPSWADSGSFLVEAAVIFASEISLFLILFSEFTAGLLVVSDFAVTGGTESAGEEDSCPFNDFSVCSSKCCGCTSVCTSSCTCAGIACWCSFSVGVAISFWGLESN